MDWLKVETDQVKPISMLDVSADEKLEEEFNWKYTQPLIKQVHFHEESKFILRTHRLHFVRAYQFFKPNDKKGKCQSIL